jgi:hypothetical protein
MRLLNLTPNTPVKIKNNYDKLPETLFIFANETG